MTVAGLALLRMGEYRGARLALERALKLQPNQFDAATTLAELNFGLGNGARGIEVLQMAARLRPQEVRVWLTMGKVLRDLGDFPKAIQAYERALGLNPDDREALIGLIGCLMDTDQADQAEASVTKALGKYPDDPRVLGFAARGAFDANRLVEAIALADRALASDPKNLDALLTRARAHVVQATVGASLARRGTRPGRLPQRPGLAPVASENPDQDGPDRPSGRHPGRASASPGSHRT